MAKSSSGTNPGQIRFRCTVCATILKVPVKMGGRYIDCPKCKGRAQVPANQKAADEDARDYDVNRLAYDTTGQCRNCGTKMGKNAVLCTKCGFDYRSGKNVEVIDKTKLPSDYPTWGKIFGAFNDNFVVTGMVKVISGAILSLVFAGVLGLGITSGCLWWFTNPGLEPPKWPWYIAFTFGGLALLAFFGQLQEAYVSVTSRALYGKEISPGSVPVAILYFLGTAIPAFILPLVLVFTLILTTEPSNTPPDPAELGAEPGFFDDAPIPPFRINEQSVLPGVLLGSVTLLFGLTYYFFGVGSYATDLSINPITIFSWIGKCIADVPAWLGITALMVLLAQLIPYGIWMGGTAFEVYGPWVSMLTFLFAIALNGYATSVAAFMAGKIIKRHL